MINYSDQSERNLIIKSFAFTGSIATAAMSFFAIIDANYPLFASLIIASSLFILPCFIKNNDWLSSCIVLYTLFILMLYLVYTGGSHGTGPIWIFIVSPVTFFMRGLRKGIIDITIFILAVIAAFVIADNFNGYQYNSPELLSRIILSFIVVALLSGFYEYFRETYSRKLIQLAKSNETLATTDPLTSLPNRRYTMERLYDEKLLSDKSNTSLTIMIVDIDDFKKVNDKYGHQIGDLALTHLADTFRKFSRKNDIFSRWGGEEFLCVLPQTNVEGAVVVAKRIQQDLLAQPIHVDQGKINLSVSVGVSEVIGTESIDLAIKKADENLYLAKSTGKNKVCSE